METLRNIEIALFKENGFLIFKREISTFVMSYLISHLIIQFASDLKREVMAIGCHGMLAKRQSRSF